MHRDRNIKVGMDLIENCHETNQKGNNEPRNTVAYKDHSSAFPNFTLFGFCIRRTDSIPNIRPPFLCPTALVHQIAVLKFRKQHSHKLLRSQCRQRWTLTSPLRLTFAKVATCQDRVTDNSPSQAVERREGIKYIFHSGEQER